MKDILYIQNLVKEQRQSRMDVPLWALSHLGKQVSLSTPWRHLDDTYPVGSVATLDGITHFPDGSKHGSNRALLVFDPEDPGSLVDVPFAYIDSPPIPLELLRLIPGHVGRIAFMWANGMDMQAILPRSSFYRYRTALLKYAVDISKPFVFRANVKPAA